MWIAWDGKQSKVVLKYAKESVPPNVVTYNILIGGLYQINKEKETFTFISKMENMGHLLDVTTYITLVCSSIEQNT